MRSALWQIWLNRDYTEYAALKGSNTLTLENWQPSSSFRMYIRKGRCFGNLGIRAPSPVTLEPTVDPYEAGTITLDASGIVIGNGEYTLNTPRDIAFAADGTLYVTDSTNNQISISTRTAT